MQHVLVAAVKPASLVNHHGNVYADSTPEGTGQHLSTVKLVTDHSYRILTQTEEFRI